MVKRVLIVEDDEPAFLTKGVIANSRNLTRQGFKPISSPPVAQNSVLRLQASE